MPLHREFLTKVHKRALHSLVYCRRRAHVQRGCIYGLELWRYYFEIFLERNAAVVRISTWTHCAPDHGRFDAQARLFHDYSDDKDAPIGANVSMPSSHDIGTLTQLVSTRKITALLHALAAADSLDEMSCANSLRHYVCSAYAVRSRLSSLSTTTRGVLKHLCYML